MAEPNFASLLSADEPTAAEQAAAWAKALRQKQALAGTLSLAGGDLAPAGALQERAADQGQAQLMHAMGQRQAKAQQLSEWQQKQLQHLQEFAYRQQHDAAMLDESRRAHEATLALAAANLKRNQENDAKGQKLPASIVEGLADLPTSLESIGGLVNDFKRLDMGGLRGKVNAAATNALDLQNTDAADYAGAALVAMQGVGKILEGGKLSNRDEDKYRRMLPRPGDSEEVVKTKVKSAQDFLRTLVQNRLTGLRAAGYDVPPEMLQRVATPSAAGGAPSDTARPPGVPANFVRVTNGKEAHWIDPAFAADAAKDGFK